MGAEPEWYWKTRPPRIVSIISTINQMLSTCSSLFSTGCIQLLSDFFCTGSADTWSSRTQTEQKELLEGETSRRVLEQSRDDSSSLVVLRDSDSLFSSNTDTEVSSLRLSTKFIFDGELLGSKVYQGTMRSLIRRVMHRGKDTRTESIRSRSIERSLLSEEKNNAARSNKIDALITKSSKEFYRKVDVLVVGLSQSGKSTLLNRMRQFQEHDSYVISIELLVLV